MGNEGNHDCLNTAQKKCLGTVRLAISFSQLVERLNGISLASMALVSGPFPQIILTRSHALTLGKTSKSRHLTFTQNNTENLPPGFNRV